MELHSSFISYIDIECESRSHALHPFILDQIRKRDPMRVLDYGCGDGRLFHNLSNYSYELYLYDPSVSMIDRAKANLASKGELVHFITDPDDIPKASFDCIIFCLVLMEIPLIRQIEEIITLFKEVSTANASCYVAVTHPCFRSHPFSTFRTDYCNDAPFDYFDDGHQFQVWIEDDGGHSSAKVVDYHWSLSTILNLFLGAGFALRSLTEIPDQRSSKLMHSSNYPPYLVLDFIVRS